jgi:hypothetical protein
LYLALTFCNQGQGLPSRDFKSIFDVIRRFNVSSETLNRWQTAEAFQEWGESRIVSEDVSWKDAEVVNSRTGMIFTFRYSDSLKVCQLYDNDIFE